MTVISSLLSEKGFTCLQNDLALPDPQTRADSSAMLKWFESGLFFSELCAMFQLIHLI